MAIFIGVMAIMAAVLLHFITKDLKSEMDNEECERDEYMALLDKAYKAQEKER